MFYDVINVVSGNFKHSLPVHLLTYKNSYDVHTVRFHKVCNQFLCTMNIIMIVVSTKSFIIIV